MKDKNFHVKAINLIALALMFLFISSWGHSGLQTARADTVGVDPCCIAGDAGCSENGSYIVASQEEHAKSLAATTVAGVQAREQGRTEAAKSTEKGLMGQIAARSCLQLYWTGFNSIASIIGGIWDMIVQALLAIVLSVLDGICSYVAGTINNLLNSICIPLPPIGLPNFSMGAPSMTYCDGISLGTAVQFGTIPNAVVFSDVIDEIPTGSELLEKFKPAAREVK